MRKLLLLFLSITTLFLWSCTESTTGGEEELQPLDFTTAPSNELSNIIQNTPNDFTWPFYNDNLTLGLDPEPESFEGEIVLEVFQVRNGEVTNRLTSDPVGTNLEELSAGLSTAEMYPDSPWFRGSEWANDSPIWVPSTQWYPGSMWTPSEIESIAMSENELSPNQKMVVVYPRVEGELPNREQVTQPYGLIFEEREPTTGTLEVITETNANGDGNEYPLAVDGNNTDTLTANDTLYVAGLQEGNHQAELKELPANCTISGQNPRSVSITAADTVSTTFEVQCEPPKSMIERFAGESSSVRVVNAEALQVRPGGLPFLHDDAPFLTNSPDNLMLIIPESASADGTLELKEMVGIVFADAERQPLELDQAYPGSQWYRFSGEEFYPGSQWISDQAQYPGSQWTPESLADMEIAFVNGAQSMTKLFGDVDFSRNSESTDSPIQSKKKLGIAARADLLFGMDVSINKDLDQVLNQPAENLNFISGEINIGGLISIVGDPTKDVGNSAIWSVSGDQFYPGSMWTPENVSAFSAFMTDIFETGNNPFLSETQMLLVGRDVFNNAPERFSLIEPGQTVDGLSNYQMFVASSVLDVDLDLYPTVGSNLDFQELSPVSSGDGTYFPASFYHPTDFTFPEQLQSPDARFVYLPFEPSYNYSAITEFGITVNIGQ